MRNLKKMAALGAAAVMALSVNVSAFAAVTATSTNANFGSYESGVAKLADTQTILDNTNQWTVVIIDADKATANLAAEDLYYINQGTGAEGFWVTNGMGTKVDLATLVNETTPTKEFIIRIGTDKVEQTGVVEIPFTINFNSGEVSVTLGDVNNDGKVDMSDVLAVLNHYLEITPLDTKYFKAADVAPIGNVDGKIDMSDVLAILNHYLEITLLF